MNKINFKQPKYIFPAIISVPVILLAYFLFQLFGGSGGEDIDDQPTDRINMNLPEARAGEVSDKMTSMTSRYNKDNSFTGIEEIGQEIELKEDLNPYDEDELQSMMAEVQRQELERQRLEELQRRIDESTRNLNDVGLNSYQQELERMQREAREQQRMAQAQREAEERAKQLEEERLAREEAERLKAEMPLLVSKVNGIESQSFNTVTITSSTDESPLIRAMIDQTTKAHEGTRLRFKLLDDVIVDNVKLLKGTYLYGTVSGFGQQRVMANINNILVGDRFIKVDLSVFDNDGMEGFYVPSSAFRDFMKNAGSSVLNGNNIQFNSGYGYGNSISGESIALQALQNIYQSATNAIGANFRKNKAKIKYNTIVYLINSRNSQ